MWINVTVLETTTGVTNTEEAAVTRGTTAHQTQNTPSTGRSARILELLGVRATTGAAQQPAGTTAPRKALLETPVNTPVDLVEKYFLLCS